MINTYVCIDLETTGLNPKTDKIIEIGAVKVEDGVITDKYATLVNPGRKLEERIVELTGIRDEDLKDAPYLDEILAEVLTFLGDLPILGHSVRFDFSFLKKAALDQKIPFAKKGIDTLKISRKYLADLEHRSLDFLCDYYQIPHKAHRALADAEATCVLYEKLTEQFYRDDEELFVPKELVCHIKRDTPATKAQKERLYRLIEQHKIVVETEIERLTRSEASRFTDKILSMYGR